jgi:CheY-like chemotaxis protein
MKTIFFLAEDDTFMARLYERVFTSSGHELVVAHDGEEALAKLKELDPKPNVIILDIMMPKLNGLDLLAKIKEDDTLKTIPVAMLTNLAGKENEERARSLGAREYLLKSEFLLDQVVEKILALAGDKK